MKFCDSCGSLLKETDEGLLCPKCRKLIGRSMVEPRSIRKEISSNAIYVVDNSKGHYARVTTKCPECGNDEAFHWFSGVSGEHAGIGRERTLEHFRCTKCSHFWSESS